MPTRVKCPTCGRPQRIPEGEPGELFLCPACGNPFRVAPPTPPPQAIALPVEPIPQPPPAGLAMSPAQWLYLGAGCIALLVIVTVVLLIVGSQRQRPGSAGSTPTLGAQNLTPATPTPAATSPASTQPWWTAAPAAAASPAPPPPAIASVPPDNQASSPASDASASPATTVAATAPARVGANPLWPPVTPASPNAAVVDTLDDRIGDSIHRGITFLLGQFKNGQLRQLSDIDFTGQGVDVLCVYALLQAGAASDDLRIGPHQPAVDRMLTAVKSFPMEHSVATYSRSLRVSALAVYDRGEDRATLRSDASWLLRAAVNGAYAYELPGPGAETAKYHWDNSNSQYGALGVWAAADAQVQIPDGYWADVQRHWVECQIPNGLWGYNGDETRIRLGRLSMTVAGITMLLVSQDQLNYMSNGDGLGQPPYSPQLAKALGWLEEGDHSVNLPGTYYTYNLYGLERAALASGLKYFGTHNWYRELAERAVGEQQSDGSWTDGGDSIVDTAMTLLFLSRGRHPIFVNKLRFDGAWANRPRDIANLTRYASQQLERPLNWQVVSLAADFSDWMDSPILYIASHQPLPLHPGDIEKLRDYAQNGGLIFTHADGDSPQFNKFVADLCAKLFPAYPLHELTNDNEGAGVYQSLFQLQPPPRLQGVSNGSRLLLVNSPNDINRAWEVRADQPHPEDFQLGLNTFIYAAGKTNFRNKLHTPLVPPPATLPAVSLPVARLRYDGNWDPEPAAWARIGRWSMNKTGVSALPVPVDLENLQPAIAPLATLTGTGAVHFTDAQAAAVRNYVNAGGVMLIDPCGGAPAFAQSILGSLLTSAFPTTPLQTLPPHHPLLAASQPGMADITLTLRPRAAEQAGSTTVALQYLSSGKGFLIYCPVDLTTALLGTNTYPINGLAPDTAVDLATNLLLWSVNRDSG